MVKRIYSDYFMFILNWIIIIILLKLLFNNYYFPFCLVLGPLLYEAHLHSISKKSNHSYLNIAGAVFILLLLSQLIFIVNGYKVDSYLFQKLNNLEDIISFISIAGFPILIFYDYRKLFFSDYRNHTYELSNKMLLTIQLAIIYIVVAFSKLLLILDNYNHHISFEFPLARINFILIFFVLFICGSYLFKELKTKEFILSDSVNAEEPISYEEELFLKKQLENIITKHQLHLRVDFSLDMLSKQTGIPKYKWSQYFSQMHMSFYEYFARYKIYYALYSSNSSNNRLTIAAMANDAGFSSVTTFSKYFKEYVGCSPSEWREKRK